MLVRLSTTDWPELKTFLRSRQQSGADLCDERRDKEYIVVSLPTPEHGRLIADLAALLKPVVAEQHLQMAAHVGIGTDFDYLVADLAIFDPDVPPRSRGLLGEALVVVQVLRPAEKPNERVDFYAKHGVRDYIEIDVSVTSGGECHLVRLPEIESAHETLFLPIQVTHSQIWTPDGRIDVSAYRESP